MLLPEETVQVPLYSTGATWLRRAVVVSVVLHALAGLIAWKTIGTPDTDVSEIDIEMAPPPPKAEALPAEVAKLPEQDRTGMKPLPSEGADEASTAPGHDEGLGMVDAGVDAAIDTRADAAIDARPDAAIDARVDAAIDARVDAAIDARVDAAIDARVDAAIDARPDAAAVAVTVPDAAADAAAVAVTVADAAADAAAVAVAATDAAADAAAFAVAVADAAAVAVAATDAAADAAAVAVAATDAGAVATAAADAATVAVAVTDAGAGTGSGSGSVAGSGSGSVAGSGSATVIATIGTGSAGSGTGSGSGNGDGGTGIGSGALGTHDGSGSGIIGTEDLPAVDGAATTPGTAANLLAYFPAGHVVTALIRFDRLRGTEWIAPVERLLRPMPDYLTLFGDKTAKIADKFDTLVISSPRPRDPAATTLVGRTALGRAGLRALLGATTPVKWSPVTGGLLGTRHSRIPRDRRVFISPFRGWFLLAQPEDIAGLTAPAKGDLDLVEATAKLPAWLAGIRKIEDESGGDKPGPTLVLTLGLDGAKIDLKGNDFGLGVPSVQTPQRISLAMEVVKQGWVVRGNMKFDTEAQAVEFLAEVAKAQARIDTRLFKMALGEPVVRLVKNLSFAQAGARVSYATSMSIKDTREVLQLAAGYLDTYFRGAGPH